MTEDLFSAPKWLRDLGLMTWLLVGIGALILGVPLAGTITVVTFVGAYVPFIGAWVGGAFAVALALAGQGETAAIVMAVIVLLANGMLQQIVQPIASRTITAIRIASVSPCPASASATAKAPPTHAPMNGT